MTEDKNTQISKDILALVQNFFVDYQERTKDWKFHESETEIFLTSNSQNEFSTILLVEDSELRELKLKISMLDLLKDSDVFTFPGLENHTLCFTVSDTEVDLIVNAHLCVELENNELPEDKVFLDNELFSSEEFDIIYVLRYYFNLVNTD